MKKGQEDQILTVDLSRSSTLEVLLSLTLRFLLSLPRAIAHLQINNSSATPKKSIIMNSMIIADPSAVYIKRSVPFITKRSESINNVGGIT